MSWQSFLESNYEVKKAGNPRGFRICCPFCGDNKFHGYVDTKNGFFKCFKCNWSHKVGGTATTAYHFLLAAHHLSEEEANKILAAEYTPLHIMEDGFPVDVKEAVEQLLEEERNEAEEPYYQKIILPDSLKLTAEEMSIIGQRAWDYWEYRTGKKADVFAKLYKVRYAVKGKHKGRIIIPVYENNKLVWFQSRAFFPAGMQPKYLNPSISIKPVFGLDMIGTEAEVIICEGIFDAITIGPSGLAVFGTIISDSQMNSILNKKPKNITVCLDPDEAGRSGAKRMCEKLRNIGGYPNLYYVLDLPSDPSSLGAGVRKTIIERRIDFSVPML